MKKQNSPGVGVSKDLLRLLYFQIRIYNSILKNFHLTETQWKITLFDLTDSILPKEQRIQYQYSQKGGPPFENIHHALKSQVGVGEVKKEYQEKGKVKFIVHLLETAFVGNWIPSEHTVYEIAKIYGVKARQLKVEENSSIKTLHEALISDIRKVLTDSHFNEGIDFEIKPANEADKSITVTTLPVSHDETAQKTFRMLRVLKEKKLDARVNTHSTGVVIFKK